ncbi:MAG TPA: pilin [Candidatus Woesebacteria bacterium]|nr:pilin [Candidatus Woesebacteria bacterium]
MHKIKNIFQLGLFYSLLPVVSPVSAQIRDWEESDCMVDGIPTLKCLEVVVGNFLLMTNAFILVVLFIMFVIGSFKYLTSLGSPDKIEEAKGTFKWAIIGLVVYVSAYLILNIIDILFLGGQGNIFRLQIGDYGL